MKLRIRDNSIRLRLTRSEVKRLEKANDPEARVQSKICFGPEIGQSLTYCIEVDAGVSKIQAEYNPGIDPTNSQTTSQPNSMGTTILIKIPETLALEWASTDRIALQGEQSVSENEVLHILIEKDFFCLKPRQHECEDESDMYPNPGVSTGNCA